MKHAGNVCDLENRNDDWCVSLRIETCFNNGIGAFGGIMTDGGVAERTMIVMNRGNGTSFWNDSCGICCGNGFSGNGVIPDDCCCSDDCGCNIVQSPRKPEKWSGLAEG